MNARYCSMFVLLAAAGCLNRPVTELDPTTSNMFVEEVPSGIHKIDLLFMIDSSPSMADKQQFFARAIPELVERLVQPSCMAVTDPEKLVPSGENGCPDGFRRQFTPVRDIHIGVVTSSLGAFGGEQCTQRSATTGRTRTFDDHAWLIGELPRGQAIENQEELGFLAWDPDAKSGGIVEASQLVTSFKDMVTAAGEDGCGYEASLEAWYRFLVDPAPPREIVKIGGADSVAVDFARDAAGNLIVDEQLLAQRRAFLRPDSLVAVIMLSDENDCSIRVPGFGAAVGFPNRLMKASTACATDPNDRCCRSCSQPPADGCPDNTEDAQCAAPHTEADDPQNLRCFEQKRRFGIDLLYPTARYSVGLSAPRLCPASPWGDADCSCTFARETYGITKCEPGNPVPNPLFASDSGLGARSPSDVYLAGIVGVPWQDLATADTLNHDSRLRFMTAGELSAAGRWPVIAGDLARQVPPTDPFMRESVLPRTGENPITRARLSGTEGSNPINGHDYVASVDLQYACTFPLAEPRSCATGHAFAACDCDDDDQNAIKNPLCQSSSGYDQLQRAAKAYPGIRFLDVLRRFGENSIVASICPKFVDFDNPERAPYAGYNPAVQSIIDRLAESLNGSCLPRRLEVDSEGQVPCVVTEVVKAGAGDCPEVSGRPLANNIVTAAVQRRLEQEGRCKGAECAKTCVYSLPALEGADLASCRAADREVSTPGYCYIDPERGLGDPALVAGCEETERRLLRIVGHSTPQPGAITYVACVGANFEQVADAGASP